MVEHPAAPSAIHLLSTSSLLTPLLRHHLYGCTFLTPDHFLYSSLPFTEPKPVLTTSSDHVLLRDVLSGLLTARKTKSSPCRVRQPCSFHVICLQRPQPLLFLSLPASSSCSGVAVLLLSLPCLLSYLPVRVQSQGAIRRRDDSGNQRCYCPRDWSSE